MDLHKMALNSRHGLETDRESGIFGLGSLVIPMLLPTLLELLHLQLLSAHKHFSTTTRL